MYPSPFVGNKAVQILNAFIADLDNSAVLLVICYGLLHWL